MKKYNLYLWLLALVGLMTACSQDETDALQNEASNRVTIGASISEALQTRAASVTIPDGYKLRYVLEVWSTGGHYACIHRNEETATTAEAVTFEFTLADAGNYKALLWADFVPTGATMSQVNSPNTYTHYADNFYTTNTENGLKAVTLAKTNKAYVINDDTRDAFFACITIEKETGAFEKSVELTRPFGQINVIEKNTELLSKVESMTLEYEVPSTFDVEFGFTLNMTEVAVNPTVSTLPNATTDRKANLFYDFIFTRPKTQTILGEIKLAFTSSDPSVTLDDFIIPSNMPVERNKRTNISGFILHTSSAPSNAAKLTVTVSDGWTEPDKEEDIDEIVLAKKVLETAWISGNSNNAEDYHYTITTLEQLEALAMLAKAGTVITGCTKSYGYANYKLGNSINLENKPWTPIDEFHGTFDGQGHTISNMNVSITTKSTDINGIDGGLFGHIGGTVRNLIVEGEVTVKGEGIFYAGGICGSLSGAITFCRFNGTVSSTTGSGDLNYAGGITGYCLGSGPTITGCIANAKVTATGGTKSGAGGLAGNAEGTDCSYSAWNSDASTGTSDMIGKLYNNVSAPSNNKSFTSISDLNKLLNDINDGVSGSDYIWEAGDSNTDYPKLGKRSSSQPN